MADQILTLRQIEDFFYSLTFQMLGLDPGTLQNPLNQDVIRIAWPTDGAPGWPITKDVIFLRVVPVPDRYIQQRETTYQNGSASNVPKTTAYTRVHSVRWTVYGPNSYENAETIRSGLYEDDAQELMAAGNLHLILDVPNITRAPELFNGQWWERCDFEARFNEQVIRHSTVPYITGANITVITDQGQERMV